MEGFMTKQVRQGDILIDPKNLDYKEGKLKYIGKNEKILAYGEKTGHNHTTIGDVVFYDNGKGSVLCHIGRDGTVLVHQEHDQINIGEGDYIVIRQREYDLIDGIRTVYD